MFYTFAVSQQDKRFQVFISSTYRDLTEERQQAVRAVLQLGAFPCGMEWFPASDDSQWQLIEREIDSSDYYVVIIAGKYGSEASDGVSYTEKEYDYAISVGKPVLAFLARSLGELKGEQLETEQHRREKLASFRDKAMKNKMVDFFTNAHDLRGCVFHSLFKMFRARPGEGWVRGGQARRIDDLAELSAARERIIELEREIHKLKSSGDGRRNLLSRGDDEACWKIRLNSVVDLVDPLTGGPAQFPPPVPFVNVATTWNALFSSLFSGGPVYSGFIDGMLEDVCSDFLAPFADSEWYKVISSGKHGKAFNISDLRRMLGDLRVQYEGLGHLQLVHAASGTMWTLTDEGRLHLALIRGRLRKNEAEHQ